MNKVMNFFVLLQLVGMGERGSMQGSLGIPIYGIWWSVIRQPLAIYDRKPGQFFPGIFHSVRDPSIAKTSALIFERLVMHDMFFKSQQIFFVAGIVACLCVVFACKFLNAVI